MCIAAIDFGGTRTRAAWFDDQLTMVARREILSRTGNTQEEVIKAIIELTKQTIPENIKPRAIGISAPGPLDIANGVILHALTLPNWNEVPLAQIISDAFHTPVWINNDANLGALAEAMMGAGKNADPVIYLTISTGIGGGMVLNRRIYTGSTNLAIEPGHMLIRDESGTLKRLEDLASGTALARIAMQRMSETNFHTSLRPLASIDGRAVGQAARDGDSFARKVVSDAGHYLGIGLVNLIHLFNPEAIVIGGSVALNQWEVLIGEATKVISEHILSDRFLHENLIRPALLQDEVCLYGAALYVRQRLQNQR